MEIIENYCPVVGKCSHEPVVVQSNSYFLIQPFDSEKEKREEAIIKALKKYYGKTYALKKSDSKISNHGVYCDICLKIKSSQYCIVDITGENYKILNDVTGKVDEKIFLRPNVALELGMAYGLNKPVFILSRKINGKRLIPSDIQFIRYVDITPPISTIEFNNWDGASQKILDQLRATIPGIYINKSSILNKQSIPEEIVMYLEYLLILKEKLPNIMEKNIEINQIIYKNGELIGIIKDCRTLIEGIPFKFYINDENGLEELVGIAESYHIQPDGIVQVKIYQGYINEHYWEMIVKTCNNEGNFVPDKNRLELIYPDEIKDTKIEDIKSILKLCKGDYNDLYRRKNSRYNR